MAQSFGVVEEKLCEAEFFLAQLRDSAPLGFNARYYFSAFVSASRCITWAPQASMSGVEGFDSWYEAAQAKLRADQLAGFFIEIRNRSEKRGLNPLNQVTREHLREHLFQQLNGHKREHVLILPDPSGGGTVLVDAVQACTQYFTSLVAVILECYEHFKNVVDPQWYFTKENFASMGKTLDDALREFGLGAEWASCVPKGTDPWRALRSQHQGCQINDLFRQYVGREIAGPDETQREG